MIYGIWIFCRVPYVLPILYGIHLYGRYLKFSDGNLSHKTMAILDNNTLSDIAIFLPIYQS